MPSRPVTLAAPATPLPPVHGSTRRWHAVAVALLLALAILPAAALARSVVADWVNIPVSDEWSTSFGITLAKAREGTLRFPYLWSQHTESRPVFPRLLALVLAGGAGEWDTRRGMALTLGLLGLASALLYVVLGAVRPRPGPAARLGVLAAMNVLLFSPAGWEIWLWGQGFIAVLPLLCLLLALCVNTSSLGLRAKAGLNAALAFGATFSFSNGLLLWPLAWPVGGARDAGARRTAWALYGAAGVATLALFFHGYRPTDPRALGYALGHPGEVLRYFLTWCAGPLLPAGPPGGGHLALGAALVGAFAAGAWAAGRAGYPWIILGLFALGSGGLAAAGRAAGGLDTALSSRYAVQAVHVLVALLGLAFVLARRAAAAGRPWRPEVTVAGTLALCGVLYGHARAWPGAVENMRGAREAREKARAALPFIDLMPQNPQFRAVYANFDHDSEFLRICFHRLRRVGLLQTPLAAPGLRDALAVEPSPLDRGAVGSFDLCQPRGVDQVVVGGWASDPNGAPGAAPARWIVFTWSAGGQTRPFTLLEAGYPRPDVAGSLGNPAMARAGFIEAIYRPILPPGVGTVWLAAWAVDPGSGAVRQLGHTFELPPTPGSGTAAAR